MGRDLEKEFAAVAQLVERRPGKAEVPGSNPGGGSTQSKSLSLFVASLSLIDEDLQSVLC